jgi:HK97 family phage prohead protease
MERMSLIGASEIKVDKGRRVIEGYASKRNRDLHGDIVCAGAFTKTISERKDRILVLRDHDPMRVAGKALRMAEDENGLYTESQIAKTLLGDETLELADSGILTGMSIGYDVIPGKVGYESIDGKSTRMLREVKLYEYSFVAFPANEEARITGVKGLYDLGCALLTLDDIDRAVARLNGHAENLTDEERGIAEAMLARLGAVTPSLSALLQPADTATASPESPAVAAVLDAETMAAAQKLFQTVELTKFKTEIQLWK